MANKITHKGEVMFPSEYLCAEDLKGQDVNLTIKTVETFKVRMRDGGSEEKWTLTFDGTDKKLILNRKSQPDSIAQMHGLKAENWPGKRITLYTARVLAFGEMVDAIRIREKVPSETPNGPDTKDCLPGEMDDVIKDMNKAGVA